jgi:hypothetical protein
MKKLLTLLLVTLTALMMFTACGKNKDPLVISETDEFVVIKCQTDKEDLTLASYMDGLDDIFLIENGMVVSINGIKNAADWSYCWMLYTDDEEMSNTAWGEIEYKDKVYGSAVLGAESLVVKNGKTYIWVYQGF